MKCTLNEEEIRKLENTKTQPRQTFDKLNYKSLCDCARRNLFYKCPRVKRVYLGDNTQRKSGTINMSIG